MIIDHENKIIFFAVPKMASTAITQYLKPVLKNAIFYDSHMLDEMNLYYHHEWARHCESKFPQFHQYLKIACVRNPFDWALSWYTYFCSPYQSKLHTQFRNMTFLEYLQCEHATNHSIGHYICNENGHVMVDHIIKFEEDLETQIRNILLLKGIHIPLDHKLTQSNVSSLLDIEEGALKQLNDCVELQSCADIIFKRDCNIIDKFHYQYYTEGNVKRNFTRML